MSRVTAVLTRLDEAQKALSELKNLGISDQHILFSHPEAPEKLADTVQESQGELSENTRNDLAVQNANRDLFYIPPNNMMGPTGMAGIGMVVPVPPAPDGEVTEEHLNLGNTARPASDAETDFYNEALQQGHILISISTEDSVQDEQVRDVLLQHGGHFFTR